MPVSASALSKAPALPAVAPDRSQVRVVTFNMKSAGGSWGGVARPEVLEDIASFLEKADPDLVVLQEVDRFTRRSGKLDQLTELGQRCGATDSFFAKALDRQDGEYGVGILCRNGFRLERSGDENVEATLLPRLGAIEPRAAVVAPIRGPGGEALSVVGTHLSVSPRVSKPQLEHLVDAAEKLSRTGAEVVLAGDFNLRPRSVRPRLREGGLEDAFERVHGPGAPRPRTALFGPVDHVAVTKEVEVLGVQTTEVPRTHPATGFARTLQDWLLGEKVSDHKAVIVDVAL